MQMKPRFLAAAASVAALSLTLGGCATGASKTTASDGAKIIDKGHLTVCTHLPYKPFQFSQGSKVVGFDVDLMDLVAKKLGLTQKIFDTPFEGIQSGQALNTDKCDVAAAGMTITDERKRVLDFSDPYFDATQALLVKKDSGISSLDQLSGKSIGVQEGTTGAIYVKEHAPKDADIRTFEDLATETAAVKTGQVDAAVNDNGVLLDYVKTNPDTAVTKEFDTGEQYGVAVKKDGNPKLLATINEVLAQAKKDGDYDKIYATWFGTAKQAG